MKKIFSLILTLTLLLTLLACKDKTIEENPSPNITEEVEEAGEGELPEDTNAPVIEDDDGNWSEWYE